jgi:hypothetical protein
MMEAASTFETSVNFYQTTRRNNPEDSPSSIENSHGHPTGGGSTRWDFGSVNNFSS